MLSSQKRDLLPCSSILLLESILSAVESAAGKRHKRSSVEGIRLTERRQLSLLPQINSELEKAAGEKDEPLTGPLTVELLVSEKIYSNEAHHHADSSPWVVGRGKSYRLPPPLCLSCMEEILFFIDGHPSSAISCSLSQILLACDL